MTVSAAVGGRRRGLRTGLWIVGGLLLVLVLAQLLLPLIAEKVAKDRLSKYGTVKSVSVSAFPAVKLLWGHADSASVSAGSLSVSPAQLPQVVKQVWEARGVTDVTMTAEQATVATTGLLAHGITIRDVHAQKRGLRLSASATLTQRQLEEAVPGFHVQFVESSGGQVRVLVGGGLFGEQAAINAFVKPSNGQLVAEPQDLPFATMTLLSAAHLRVESVAMTVIRREPLTYRISLRASLI